MNQHQPIVCPIFLVLCALPTVMASENTNLETWEVALIAGVGTLSLLMCSYSIYIIMRKSSKRKADIESGTAPPGKIPPNRVDGKAVDKGAPKVGKGVDKGAPKVGKVVDKGAPKVGKVVDGKAPKDGKALPLKNVPAVPQPNNYREKHSIPHRNSGGRRHSI